MVCFSAESSNCLLISYYAHYRWKVDYYSILFSRSFHKLIVKGRIYCAQKLFPGTAIQLSHRLQMNLLPKIVFCAHSIKQSSCWISHRKENLKTIPFLVWLTSEDEPSKFYLPTTQLASKKMSKKFISISSLQIGDNTKTLPHLEIFWQEENFRLLEVSSVINLL
jgi:hypothetical protein